MKKWIVPDAGDQNSIQVIGANFRPKDAIVEVPIDPLTNKPEEAEWLIIQDIPDDQGGTYKQAVVDSALKQSILTDRANQETARADAKAIRDAEIARLFQRADEFDKMELVSLDSVRDAIGDIVEVLRLMNGVK